MSPRRSSSMCSSALISSGVPQVGARELAPGRERQNRIRNIEGLRSSISTRRDGRGLPARGRVADAFA